MLQRTKSEVREVTRFRIVGYCGAWYAIGRILNARVV